LKYFLIPLQENKGHRQWIIPYGGLSGAMPADLLGKTRIEKPIRKRKMLSSKVIEYCKAKGWWFEELSRSYADVMRDLGIPSASPFAQFYSHAENGPVFYSRRREIYQIGWFSINSQYKLEVAELAAGKKLNDFLVGDASPQWKSFNDFLEWYFELN
jgi:hypothetical protein